MSKPAVIVINSHVVRGSVGGRASVFALERMGFPVWAIPTVVFPWHLGHGRATRIAPGASGFASLLADLAGAPWLGEVGAVLSGYLGAAEQAGSIAKLVAAVRKANPSALFLCDPIVGDSAGLFQPEAVAQAIRDDLMPLADIVTPNRHELAWLTNRSLDDNAAIAAAVRTLDAPEAVITSAFAEPGEIAALVVSSGAVDRVSHKRLPRVPHGTGDLFAALYLGHRLEGLAATESAASAASSVLALIEIAAETGADEMPLAAGQRAFDAEVAGVTVASIG